MMGRQTVDQSQLFYLFNLENDLADPFEWGDAWVQYPICKNTDVGHAVWLFRLGYDRLNGTGIARLRQRVIDYRVPAALRRRA